MAGLQTDILVNENYDRPYIYALWQRCRAIQEKRHLSQRQFYDKEIEPTLEYELKRIKIARDPKFQFEFPYVGPDRKIIRDFLSKGVAREFGLPIIQMIDAYVQLASPKFVTLVNAKDDLDKMGEIVGYFLRDPQVGELGYLLAQAKQKLLHFSPMTTLTHWVHMMTQPGICVCLSVKPRTIFLRLILHLSIKTSPRFMTKDYVSTTGFARLGRISRL